MGAGPTSVFAKDAAGSGPAQAPRRRGDAAIHAGDGLGGGDGKGWELTVRAPVVFHHLNTCLIAKHDTTTHQTAYTHQVLLSPFSVLSFSFFFFDSQQSCSYRFSFHVVWIIHLSVFRHNHS
jgi:hypothetical protein